jgi:hypothetical protein
VEVVLGADGSPRHQQACLLGDHGVGVDDAKVDSGHPIGVQVVVLLDGDGGGDRQPQPSTVGQ